MEHSYRFFENRDCHYFPCHEKEGDFNCLFCYCPLYSKSDCPGNPRYKEIRGKQVKICTDCTFPHIPGNYDFIMERLKNDP